MQIEKIKGIAFPFHFDKATGGVAKASGKEKIRQNLRQLLSTLVGERLLERQYGCGIRRFLYAPNDEALLTLARYEIQKAIVTWEPRIAIQSIVFQQKDAELIISINYICVDVQDQLDIPIEKL